jgi:D-aminoacyl-tRNA deacylase
VYLGVAREDSEKDAEWMAEKITNLRIFEDAQGKMNLSLLDIVAQNKTADTSIGVLAVSQFTLLADASKGRRPYYGEAASPKEANGLYECFMEKIRERGLVCEAGIFQAHMDVSYTNDGPVTIILDSH